MRSMVFDKLSKRRKSKAASRGGSARGTNLQSRAGAAASPTPATDLNQQIIRPPPPRRHLRRKKIPDELKRELNSHQRGRPSPPTGALRGQSPLGFFKPPTHVGGEKHTSLGMATLIDPAGRPIKARQEPASPAAALSGQPPQGPAAHPRPGAHPAPGAPAKAPPAGGKQPLIKNADIASFAADVVDASMEVPIIVDF